MYKYLQPEKIRRIEKSMLLPKIRRIEKSMLLLKIRRIEKSLLLPKNQADWGILAFTKNQADWEILAFAENQAVERFLGGVEIPAPGEKPAFVEKLAELEKQLLFRLGGISSCWLLPGLADEHIQILVDVMNLACCL